MPSVRIERHKLVFAIMLGSSQLELSSLGNCLLWRWFGASLVLDPQLSSLELSQLYRFWTGEGDIKGYARISR